MLAQTARLDDALGACEKERQRANELQERVARLKQQLEEQAITQLAQEQDHVAALEAQAIAHAARMSPLETALEAAQARQATVSEALHTAQAEIDALKSEVQRLHKELGSEGDSKQQLCLEIARHGHCLADARAEAESLRVQITQLTTQLAEADRLRALMVSEAARNAEALGVAEARRESLEMEAQDLAGRLSSVEFAYSKLSIGSRDLSYDFQAVREEHKLAQERAAQLEMRLSLAEAAAAAQGTVALQVAVVPMGQQSSDVGEVGHAETVLCI